MFFSCESLFAPRELSHEHMDEQEIFSEEIEASNILICLTMRCLCNGNFIDKR